MLSPNLKKKMKTGALFSIIISVVLMFVSLGIILSGVEMGSADSGLSLLLVPVIMAATLPFALVLFISYLVTIPFEGLFQKETNITSSIVVFLRVFFITSLMVFIFFWLFGLLRESFRMLVFLGFSWFFSFVCAIANLVFRYIRKRNVSINVTSDISTKL